MNDKNLNEQMARLRIAREQLDESGRLIAQGEHMHQKALVMLQQARFDHRGTLGDAEHSVLTALGGKHEADTDATSKAKDVEQICSQIGQVASGCVAVVSVWPAYDGKTGFAPKEETRRVQLIAHGPDPMPLRIYRLGEDGVWRFEQQIDHSVKPLEVPHAE